MCWGPPQFDFKDGRSSPGSVSVGWSPVSWTQFGDSSPLPFKGGAKRVPDFDKTRHAAIHPSVIRSASVSEGPTPVASVVPFLEEVSPLAPRAALPLAASLACVPRAQLRTEESEQREQREKRIEQNRTNGTGRTEECGLSV